MSCSEEKSLEGNLNYIFSSFFFGNKTLEESSKNLRQNALEDKANLKTQLNLKI